MYRGPPDSSHEAQAPSWSTAGDSRSHFPTTSFLAYWFKEMICLLGFLPGFQCLKTFRKIGRPFALVHLGSGNTPNPRGLKHWSTGQWEASELQASRSKNSQVLFFFININRSSTVDKIMNKNVNMLSANPSTSWTSLLDRILGHHQCTPPLPCICRPIVHHSRLVGRYVLQEIKCC